MCIYIYDNDDSPTFAKAIVLCHAERIHLMLILIDDLSGLRLFEVAIYFSNKATVSRMYRIEIL